MKSLVEQHIKFQNHLFSQAEKYMGRYIESMTVFYVDGDEIVFGELAYNKDRGDQWQTFRVPVSAIENVFPNESLNIKKLGEVIKWVVNDVHKEEADTLAKNNLTEKDVNRTISDCVKKMFLAKLN